MHRLAICLSDYLIKNGVAEESQKEQYVYGLEVTMGKVLNYSTLLILALISRTLIPSIFFMIVFFSIRERTGGYHAKTSLRCYLGTILIYLFISQILATWMVGRTWIYIVILAFSWIAVIAFAPVNHPNLNLTNKEISECRKSSITIMLLITFCIYALSLFDIKSKGVTYAVIGVGAAAILLCLAKLTRQEVKACEEGSQ